MLLFAIGLTVIFIITIPIIALRRYKKELKSQDWYDEFQYEFQSTQCPHEKHIKLAETNWKFYFTMKKEIKITADVGVASASVHRTRYRFYCEECGKKRWFKMTRSVRDHKGLFHLRLKYLFLTGGAILLYFILFGNLFDWLLGY